jgi:hypothetical protein
MGLRRPSHRLVRRAVGCLSTCWTILQILCPSSRDRIREVGGREADEVKFNMRYASSKMYRKTPGMPPSVEANQGWSS